MQEISKTAQGEFLIGPVRMGWVHVEVAPNELKGAFKELHSFGRNITELINNAHFFYVDRNGDEVHQEPAVYDHRAIEHIYYAFKKFKGVES